MCKQQPSFGRLLLFALTFSLLIFFLLSFSRSPHFGWNVTVLEKTSIFTKRIGEKHTNPLLPFHLRLCWVMKTASPCIRHHYNAFWLSMPFTTPTTLVAVCYCFIFATTRWSTPGYVFEWVWMCKYRHSKCMKSTLSRLGLHRTPSTRKTDKTFFEHKLNKLFKRLALTFNFEWFWVMSSTW